MTSFSDRVATNFDAGLSGVKTAATFLKFAASKFRDRDIGSRGAYSRLASGVVDFD